MTNLSLNRIQNILFELQLVHSIRKMNNILEKDSNNVEKVNLEVNLIRTGWR